MAVPPICPSLLRVLAGRRRIFGFRGSSRATAASAAATRSTRTSKPSAPNMVLLSSSRTASNESVERRAVSSTTVNHPIHWCWQSPPPSPSSSTFQSSSRFRSTYLPTTVQSSTTTISRSRYNSSTTTTMTRFNRRTTVKRVTIPCLSPTHTRAKIVKFLVDTDAPAATSGGSDAGGGVDVECYTPLMVLQCSPDLVTEGYREHIDHEPQMLIESHEEGRFFFHNDDDPNNPKTSKLTTATTKIELDKWYPVGTTIGYIVEEDDDDSDGDGDEGKDTTSNNSIETDEWLWQAYSH